MNILYLANLIPYPLDGGGKIFTFSTIQALSKDNSIDLVCFYEHENVENGINELKKYCKSVEVLPIRVTTRENMPLMVGKAFVSLYSKLPLGISKYIVPEMKNLIRKKISNKKYDCAFFNILAMYGYSDYIKTLDPQIKTVLYEQNCEALIYRRYYHETKNLLKKAFLKMETVKLNRFEQDAVSSVDQLIVLSNEDRKELKVLDQNCEIIPIGVQEAKSQKKYGSGKLNKIRILFVGTMTWAPNSEGIGWFLDNVMPLCDDPAKYELYIIGKNPSVSIKTLSAKYPNVHLMGYVESLDDIYDKCDVLIVPLFIGSGQRVKIIEAFARGYAVISTSIGAEGLKYIPDKTIMIANDAQDFKDKIDSCFDESVLRVIGKGGKAVFDEEYSTEVIAKRLNEVVGKTSNR